MEIDFIYLHATFLSYNLQHNLLIFYLLLYNINVVYNYLFHMI
jgi:hypothetical protein